MQRDRRRGSQNWQGCHFIKNVIYDGDLVAAPRRRTGGLKMGGIYWYYVCTQRSTHYPLRSNLLQYMIDDKVEYCDPNEPYTTNCPLLPGQPVNILDIPQDLDDSYDLIGHFAMSPADRFVSPKRRLSTATGRSTAAGSVRNSQHWSLRPLQRLHSAPANADSPNLPDASPRRELHARAKQALQSVQSDIQSSVVDVATPVPDDHVSSSSVVAPVDPPRYHAASIDEETRATLCAEPVLTIRQQPTGLREMFKSFKKHTYRPRKVRPEALLPPPPQPRFLPQHFEAVALAPPVQPTVFDLRKPLHTAETSNIPAGLSRSYDSTSDATPGLLEHAPLASPSTPPTQRQSPDPFLDTFSNFTIPPLQLDSFDTQRFSYASDERQRAPLALPDLSHHDVDTPRGMSPELPVLDWGSPTRRVSFGGPLSRLLEAVDGRGVVEGMPATLHARRASRFSFDFDTVMLGLDAPAARGGAHVYAEPQKGQARRDLNNGVGCYPLRSNPIGRPRAASPREPFTPPAVAMLAAERKGDEPPGSDARADMDAGADMMGDMTYLGTLIV